MSNETFWFIKSKWKNTLEIISVKLGEYKTTLKDRGEEERMNYKNLEIYTHIIFKYF